MKNTYFGEFADGRLLRMPYFKYLIILFAIMFGFMLATVMLIGAAENIIGGDLTNAQDVLRNALGLPYLVILGVVMIGIFIALSNITAKRARDTGLPGWLFVTGIIVISALLSYFLSDQLSRTFSSIIGFGLLLIPSNVFARKNHEN